MNLGAYIPEIRRHLFGENESRTESMPVLAHMDHKTFRDRQMVVMSFHDNADRYIGVAIDFANGQMTVVTPEMLADKTRVVDPSCYFECMDTCGYCPEVNPPWYYACSAGCQSGCGG